MRKNRDRLSLVAAILEVASIGASKTKIMFLANLSYKLLEKYLQATLHLGFIQLDGPDYRLTEKGLKFLEKYAHFHNRYHRAQEELQNLAAERELLSRLCGDAKGSFRNRSAARKKVEA